MTDGMSWYSGHSRVTNRYTLLLNYSQLRANVVTCAQLVSLRSIESAVHSLQMNTGERAFQSSAKRSLFKINVIMPMILQAKSEQVNGEPLYKMSQEIRSRC